MNCANHPEATVEVYCQYCGRALCSQCVRIVAGVVFCEPCLAARLGIPPADTGAGSAYAGNYPYTASGPLPSSGIYPEAKPGLAGFLGLIPGVGAMYNGQFVKALVHVLVFVILVSITDEHGLFGIFISAWIFYQVFDAYQTAKARRDGLPLPDPFGLNDLGSRLGLHPVQPAATAPAGPHAASPGYPPSGYQAPPYYPPPPEGSPAYGVPYPLAPPPESARRGEPVGAIVLIALGVMFLFSSLGILHMGWIGHGWPIVLIVLGGWLIFRRTRDLPNGGAK